MNWEGQVRPVPEGQNDALLRALRHPFRRLLLRHYVEAAKMLSPKELAFLTRQPLSNVSYHVRQLAQAGAVEIAEEAPVRGSVQHFYVASALVKETPWVLATLGLN